MRKRDFLVCFTGVDGSGKTSHAKSLLDYLEELGYSCKYVWGGFRPFFSYLFFVFTRLLGYWKYTKKDAYTDPLEYAPNFLARKIGKIWRFLVFIDYQLKALIEIRSPLLAGKVVVCDRYYYDLLMELQLTNLSSKKFVALLSKSLPNSLVTFLFDIPEALASSRRNFPKEFYSERRKTFLWLAKRFKFIIIDSSKDFSENQHKVRSEALKRLQDNEDNVHL